MRLKVATGPSSCTCVRHNGRTQDRTGQKTMIRMPGGSSSGSRRRSKKHESGSTSARVMGHRGIILERTSAQRSHAITSITIGYRMGKNPCWRQICCDRAQRRHWTHSQLFKRNVTSTGQTSTDTSTILSRQKIAQESSKAGLLILEMRSMI